MTVWEGLVAVVYVAAPPISRFLLTMLVSLGLLLDLIAETVLPSSTYNSKYSLYGRLKTYIQDSFNQAVELLKAAWEYSYGTPEEIANMKAEYKARNKDGKRGCTCTGMH